MMKQQLVTMLDLQDSMNAKVHPEWRSQGFEWYRAIWIECGELMDHFGWKWWKKQTPDREQVVLELIDIWHFGLSALLEAHPGPVDTLAEEVTEGLAQARAPGDFLQDVEVFANQVLSTRQFAPAAFANLMLGMDLSFEELYRQYVGKNVLNMFRQDKGYKTGTYQKVWDGREDNEHLVEVVKAIQIDSDAFQTLVYEGLLARYPASEETPTVNT